MSPSLFNYFSHPDAGVIYVSWSAGGGGGGGGGDNGAAAAASSSSSRAAAAASSAAAAAACASFELPSPLGWPAHPPTSKAVT